MTNKKNDKTATELLLMRTKCPLRHPSHHAELSWDPLIQGHVGLCYHCWPALEIWGAEFYPTGMQARKHSPGTGGETLLGIARLAKKLTLGRVPSQQGSGLDSSHPCSSAGLSSTRLWPKWGSARCSHSQWFILGDDSNKKPFWSVQTGPHQRGVHLIHLKLFSVEGKKSPRC